MFGGFGSTANTPSPAGTLFGASTPGTTSALGSSNLINSTAGTLFGTSSSTTLPTSNSGFGTSFGSTPATSTTGGFGGFGAAPATSTAGGFSGFGATPATSTTSGLSGFGTAPATSTASGFGGFGTTPATSNAGGFGTAPATNTASGFGGFGTTPATSNSGGFGTAPATNTASGFGGFGTTPATSNAGGFGTAPATSTASGFGGFGTTPAASTFGTSTATSSGGFGASTAAKPAFGSFGNNTLFGAKPQQPAFGSQQTQTGFGNQQQQSGIPPPVQEKVWQNFALIRAHFDPTSPLCQFRHYFYNMVPPNEVHLYVRPQNQDEQLWNEAQRKNPDPTTMVPVLAVGFDDILKRMEIQSKQQELHQTKLRETAERLASVKIHYESQTLVKLEEHKRRHRDFAQRLLRLLRYSQVLRYKNLPLSADEENSMERLNRLNNLQDRPEVMNQKLMVVWNKLQEIKARRTEDEIRRGSSKVWCAVNDDDLDSIGKVLEAEQKGIQYVADVLKYDTKELDLIESALKERRKSNDTNMLR